MIGGGDSVRIAVPFALGTSLSVLFGKYIMCCAGIISLSVLSGMAVLSAMLLSGKGNMRRTGTVISGTAGITFLAGCFAGMTQIAGSVSASGPFWKLHEATVKVSGVIMDTIDGMSWSDPQNGALVKALLTGNRDSLDSKTEECFRTSGASHLLALSGMHLGIIYTLVSRPLSWIFRSRKASAVRAAAVISASAFFTVMTGAGPSIVRALLYIILNETAMLSGRCRNGANTLCMALLIQLAAAPESICSIAFQLSYLAMAGIAFLYPAMRGWFPDDDREWRPIKKIWDAAALSISCQIFTAPAVWYHFGTFPRYFLVTNLLAIPVTTALMSISVPAIAMHAAGICPSFVITAADTAAGILRKVLGTISEM